MIYLFYQPDYNQTVEVEFRDFDTNSERLVLKTHHNTLATKISFMDSSGEYPSVDVNSVARI